jgi:hypothetical protein
MKPGAMHTTSAKPALVSCANVVKLSCAMMNAPMPDCRRWPLPDQAGSRPSAFPLSIQVGSSR